MCGIAWPSAFVEARVLNGAILICGATGHTGNLIATTAADQGARPILAGRYLDRVKAVAEPLGLRNDSEIRAGASPAFQDVCH